MKEDLKAASDRIELILFLNEMREDGSLKGFTDNIFEGYGDTLQQISKIVSGKDMKHQIGVVIALRQMAEAVTKDCERLGIPLFAEMVDFFSEHFGYESVSYAGAPKEDDDE